MIGHIRELFDVMATRRTAGTEEIEKKLRKNEEEIKITAGNRGDEKTELLTRRHRGTEEGKLQN
jgi:hypothetical protein